MSKKERIRERWEGKERFPVKTGRGNCNVGEIELVKEHLRKNHPAPCRKVDMAKSTGIGQDRILIILNLLSGVSEDNQREDADFISKDFLVYEDEDDGVMRYGIAKDAKLSIGMESSKISEGENNE
jgi:hypothetical protein